jgi:L-alanine-DL-glutamate epimerase-like enolase superfamily enzyme
VTKPPVYACDYSDELSGVDSRGHVPVPDAPGLGTPVNWEFVNRQRLDVAVFE